MMLFARAVGLADTIATRKHSRALLPQTIPVAGYLGKEVGIVDRLLADHPFGTPAPPGPNPPILGRSRPRAGRIDGSEIGALSRIYPRLSEESVPARDQEPGGF